MIAITFHLLEDSILDSEVHCVKLGFGDFISSCLEVDIIHLQNVD